jgi:hypothetical protein
MSPFADEGNIQGSKCGSGGDSWHLNILLDILREGIMFVSNWSSSVTMCLPH